MLRHPIQGMKYELEIEMIGMQKCFLFISNDKSAPGRNTTYTTLTSNPGQEATVISECPTSDRLGTFKVETE